MKWCHCPRASCQCPNTPEFPPSYREPTWDGRVGAVCKDVENYTQSFYFGSWVHEMLGLTNQLAGRWAADRVHFANLSGMSSVPDARSEPQGAPRQPRMQRLADADRPSVASTVLESKEAHFWPALHTSCFFQHAQYRPALRVTKAFSLSGPSPGRHSVTRYKQDTIIEAQRSWAAGSMVVRSCTDGARYRSFNSGMASSSSEAANSGGQGESSVAHCSM